MNCAELPIQQMAEAAGKVIFGEMFSAPKDEDPKWVKQTWERVVAAIESALIYFPDAAMDKLTRCRIREAAFSEAADWHQGEAERKRVCAEKNRTLRAQISTHMVSEAAIRSLAANVSSMVSELSLHAQALNVEAIRRTLADLIGHAKWADVNFDISYAHLHEAEAVFSALSSQPVSDGRPCSMDEFAAKLLEEKVDGFDISDAVREWVYGDWDAALSYLSEETAAAIRHPLPSEPGASK